MFTNLAYNQRTNTAILSSRPTEQAALKPCYLHIRVCKGAIGFQGLGPARVGAAGLHQLAFLGEGSSLFVGGKPQPLAWSLSELFLTDCELNRGVARGIGDLAFRFWPLTHSMKRYLGTLIPAFLLRGFWGLTVWQSACVTVPDMNTSDAAGGIAL